MGRFLRNSKGMALILTILIISLIVSLTVQFNASMRSNLYAAANLRDGIKLGYIAKSGFNYVLAVLIEDALKGNVDSLREPWADPKALSENSGAQFDEGEFEVKVSDHSGRIQINKLVGGDGKNYDNDQKDLLTRFLKSFGIGDEEANDIVDAIKDWIDADDDPTGLGGVENSYYQALEKPYSCKNAPFEFLEELLLVRGITKELFYGTKEKPGIESYLSPHGDGRININTADLAEKYRKAEDCHILLALSEDIDVSMVDSMREYREDQDNEESLADSNWYKSVPGMSHVNIADSLLTTSSTYFEITSEGFKRAEITSEGFKEAEITSEGSKGAMAKRVTGMVERKEGTLRILSWKIE